MAKEVKLRQFKRGMGQGSRNIAGKEYAGKDSLKHVTKFPIADSH